jgi:hypothetical protein
LNIASHIGTNKSILFLQKQITREALVLSLKADVYGFVFKRVFPFGNIVFLPEHNKALFKKGSGIYWPRGLMT